MTCSPTGNVPFDLANLDPSLTMAPNASVLGVAVLNKGKCTTDPFGMLSARKAEASRMRIGTTLSRAY